jgi:hypothetical protein
MKLKSPCLSRESEEEEPVAGLVFESPTKRRKFQGLLETELRHGLQAAGPSPTKRGGSKDPYIIFIDVRDEPS